jgi:hypothetical protein
MPQTGRIIEIGGASSGGGSGRAGIRQRTIAMAMLTSWKAMAKPQIAAAAQIATVIVKR